MTTYYDATELYNIQKLTGRKVYVCGGKEGYLDTFSEDELYGYIFCEGVVNEDGEIDVEVTYWDNEFECCDDGYYNYAYIEIYGMDDVERVVRTREEDGDVIYDDDPQWEKDLNGVIV